MKSNWPDILLTQQQSSTAWLLFFRINIPLFALIHFASIQGNFNDFYSFNSYVYPDILDASYDHYSFTIFSLREFLRSIHIDISFTHLLTFCRWCYPFFLLLLCSGLLTRLTAVLCLFFQLLMIKSIYMYEYGVDYFTTIALFYCCIFPVGSVFSLDNLIFKSRGSVNQKIFLSLLKAHLCIAYFFSGIEKLIGESWRNGEAVWKSLHSYNYFSLANLNFLADTPFFHISGWSTIVLEMFYPIFMNINKMRRYWLAGIIGMHVFIALFMGLFFFAALMIIFNLTTYYMPYAYHIRSLGTRKHLVTVNT